VSGGVGVRKYLQLMQQSVPLTANIKKKKV
jgi:hypothetical protein